MHTIKVSTITPCFRMKVYLKKFLDELPLQTYFEHLEVVLDHNEPDEEEIQWVKDFDAKHPGKIKHIIIPKVDPIGISMNRCIKEASGELVTIWNVDDLRTPISIESQVNAIVDNKADISFGDYTIVRKFGAVEGTLVEHGNIPETEYKRSMVFGPFVMFRKSLCDKAGYFDEQLKSGADFDLAIRLAFNGKVALTKDLLGYYLNEGKGASTRPNSKQPAERTVIELRYGIFDKMDLSFLPATVEYSIPHIVNFGKTLNVKDFVAGYQSIISNNAKDIHMSILSTLLLTTTGFRKLAYLAKVQIKKLILKQ
ncbi:MAG: glycosyltransferase [Patescibacteria group bacterium]